MKYFILIITAITFYSCNSFVNEVNSSVQKDKSGNYFYYENVEFSIVGSDKKIILQNVEKNLGYYLSLKDSTIIYRDKIITEKFGKKIYPNKN